MLLFTGSFFNAGGGGSSPPPSPAGDYALVYKTGDQSGFDTVAITWQAEVSDAQGLHDNSTNNSRFTIPAAWDGRYVRLTGNNVASADGGVLSMWKDGSDFLGMGRVDYVNTAGNDACNVVSAPVLAAEGNYFEFQGTVNAAGDLFADDGTWGHIELLPSDFEGALVYKSGDQSITGGVNTAVTFDSESYDHNGYHDNVTNNTRLTVPASGVSLVRLMGGFRCGDVSGQMVLRMQKDGGDVYGLPRIETDSSGFDVLCGMSAPIAVSATNYFEMIAFHNTNTVVAADNMTWFAIQKLPAALKYSLVRRGSNQAISSGTNTIVNWDTEVADTDAWHDAGTPSRLTVPSGVSRVRVGFNITTEASLTGQLVGEILKNGASFLGKARHETDTAGADAVGGWTGILEVTPGDYFEVNVFSTNSMNVGTNAGSWFSIEEVPDAT